MTAESDTPAATDAAAAPDMKVQDDTTFQVLAQYVKDLSFEAPSTPQVFNAMKETQPDIKVNVDVRASQLQAEAYEVILQINAECKVGDKTAFLLELVYGALVHAKLTPDTLSPALLIETPRHLFPFARNIVADTTRDGGFQPLMLAPMDFVTMYQQTAKSQAENGTSPAAAAAEAASQV